MKLFPIFLLISLLSLAAATPASAQGSLTPPGPPAPTMRSLDQIEARTPITSAPYAINSPGSYYLANNLSVNGGDAVTINASGVTLNLNGFTISSNSGPASGTAILINGGPTNISISNGAILSGVTNNGGSYGGNGFANGIYYSVSPPRSARVSGISITGVLSTGINVGVAGTVVESCTVWTAGYVGVEAQYAINTRAIDCGYSGLYVNTADNCYGYGATYGIRAFESANNCYGLGTGSSGSAIQTSTATNCRAFAYGSDYALSVDAASNCIAVNSGTGGGIFATTTVENSYGRSVGIVAGGNDTFGIHAGTVMNSYGLSDQSFGIEADSVTNCHGESGSQLWPGIGGQMVTNSYGLNTYPGGGGAGIQASWLVAYCVGRSNGTSLSSYAIDTWLAIGCVAYNAHYGYNIINAPGGKFLIP